MVAWSPEGFVNPESREIWARHAFALFQLLISLTLYVLLFVAKLDVFSLGPPRVPTLCYVLVLAMLLCWTLAALSFTFDRFRVPVLAVLLAYGWVMSEFPQGDHFFASQQRRGAVHSVTPDALLARRAGRPAVVVAATGGGIQAAAWTARVLAGLQADAQTCGTDFDQAVVAISAVSGGSVGAMYFVDAYRGGRLPPGTPMETAVRAAEASSLDDVAWGLTYPDAVWTVAPFLRGLSIVPRPHLVNGPNLLVDRGTALENSWKRTPSLATATLDDWRRDAATGNRPAVIFNSTIVETGERMLLGTTSLDAKDAIGRVDFGTDRHYLDSDVQVVTAVRLSATFPYVSPPARLARNGVFDDEFHMVDGGYYDNYGTATLVEWLNQAFSGASGGRPSKILLLQIRSFPTEQPGAPPGKRGWLFEAAHPLETLYNVRGAGQLSHSDVNVALLQRARPDVTSIIIEFPSRVAEDLDDVAPPLSWHLTPQDRGRLRAAWSEGEVRSRRAEVNEFLRNPNATGPASAGCIK